MGDSSAHIQPGTVLADKYRVDEVLGEGGMGIVVRATHLLLDEPVALKFLLPDLATSHEASARFLREAKAAMRIRGAHVAQVLDVGRLEGGEPYIVMEYLVGRDLDAELEARGPLPIPEAVDAILQACRALHGAHAAGVVHRDIKPANLFRTTTVDGEPLIKVLDFGISKLSGDRVDALTKTSTTMGSALYMSPEQLKSSRDVDHRTDIYALGVTLYELLTGEFPFMAETMPQLVAAVLTEPPEPLSQRRGDVPAVLEAAVARAMARDPAERHQSASDLARALAPFGTLGGRASLASLDPMVPTQAYGSPDPHPEQATGMELDDTRLPQGGEAIAPTVPRGPGGSTPGTLVSPGHASASAARVDASGAHASISSGRLPAGFDATGPPTSQTIPGGSAGRHRPVLVAGAIAALLLAIAIPVAVLDSGDDATPAGPAAPEPSAHEDPVELVETPPNAPPSDEDDVPEPVDDAASDEDHGDGGHEPSDESGATPAPASRPVPRPVPHPKTSPTTTPTPAKPKPTPDPGDNIFDAHQ